MAVAVTAANSSMDASAEEQRIVQKFLEEHAFLDLRGHNVDAQILARVWGIDCGRKETFKLSSLLDKCWHVLHPNMVFPNDFVQDRHRNIARFLVLLQLKHPTRNITLSQIDGITEGEWQSFLFAGYTGIPSVDPFEAWLLSGRRSPMSRALLDDIKNFESRRSPMSPALLDDIRSFDSRRSPDSAAQGISDGSLESHVATSSGVPDGVTDGFLQITCSFGPCSPSPIVSEPRLSYALRSTRDSTMGSKATPSFFAWVCLPSFGAP